MSLSIPNTLANNTNADATKVQQNFDEIATYVNTNVVLKDASVAFTAVPSGPAANPTTDNQLARKKYVDDSIAAVNLSVGGDLSGTTSNAQIVANAVGTTEIAATAVTTAKIADAAITEGKIATDAVTAAKIAAGAVGTSELASSAVTNVKVASGSFSNIQNIAASLPCGRATSAAAQSLPSSASWQNVTLGFEVYDPEGMHSTSSNSQRITAAQAGFYQFNAYVRFTGTGAGAVLGSRGLRLVHYLANATLNSIVALNQRYVGNTTEPHAICIAGGTYLSAGDYIDLQVFQDSGYTLNLLYDGDGVSSLSWNCVRLA